jgi:hypothetical protein
VNASCVPPRAQSQPREACDRAGSVERIEVDRDDASAQSIRRGELHRGVAFADHAVNPAPVKKRSAPASTGE